MRVLGKPNAATAASNQASGVPMPGIDKARGRVVALVVLLILAAVALRGYLPGGARARREPPTDDMAAFLAVIALLSVSIAIVAIAIIARLRDRRAAPASAEDRKSVV